jgi:hypothetical protein
MAVKVLGLFSIFFGILTWRVFRYARKRRMLADGRVVLLGNGLLICFLLSSVLGMLEIYFAHWYEGTDNFGASSSTVAWMEKYYRHNNWGFRDNIDYLPDRPVGQPAVVILGDSSTEGAGIENVDDRFGNLLRLGHQGSWDVRILARGGNSTGAELRDLIDVYQKNSYRADLVVVVYDINDVLDLSEEYIAWETRGNERARAILDRPWLQSSALASYVLARYAASTSYNIEEYAEIVERAYSGHTWLKETLRLRVLRDLCRSQGGEMALVALASHNRAQTYLLGERTSQLESILRDWCQKNGVPFLGLQSVYDEHSDVDFAVSETDDHPNERAHQAFADRIDPFVSELVSKRLNPNPNQQREELASFMTLAHMDWLDTPTAVEKLKNHFKSADPNFAAEIESSFVERQGTKRP